MEIDALRVRIEADLGDIRRELRNLNNQVNRTEQEVRGSFTAIGRTMRAVLTGALAQQAAKFSVILTNMASDVEEMQSKSSVVFGQFVDDVRQELDEFAAVVGRSRFELEGMAASIQDTFVPLGFARGEAAKLSTELTKLAVDVGAFNNMADAEVMEAFQSALVGNHETVLRFGVVIKEATLQQELFNIGINKNIQDATEQEKVMARLSIITKGTGDAHGTAAREADTFAGQAKKLDGAFSDLGITVGQILTPGMSTLQSMFIAAAEGANDLLEVLNKPGGLADAIRTIAEDTGVFGDLLKADKTIMLIPGQPIIRLSETKKEFDKLIPQFKTLDEVVQKLKAEIASGDAPTGTEEILNLREAELEAVSKRLEVVIGLLEKFKEAGNDIDFTSPLRATVGEGVVMPRPRPDFGPAAAPAVLDPDALKLQEQFADKIQDLKNEIALLSAEFNGSTEAQLAFLELQQQFPGLADENIKKLVEERFALAEKVNLQQAERDILNELQEANRDLNMEQQGVSDVERELIELRRQAGVVMFENEEEIRKLIAANQDLERTLNREKDSFEEISRSIEENVGNAIEGLIAGTTSAKDAFRQMTAAIIKDLIRLAFQMDKTSQAGGGGGGLLGGLFKIFSGSGGTIGAGGLTWMTGGTSGPLGLPDAFASGGSVNPNRPYLVGERGPELVIPKSASMVMNSNNTRSAMANTGGTVVQQVFNISTGVQDTVRAEIQSMMPQFEQRAVTAVASAKARGGAIGRRL